MNAAQRPGVLAAPITDALLEQFSAFLSRRIGLHFPRPRWPDMLRGVERAAHEFTQAGPEACMRWLLATPLEQRQIEILASHLTVGETYFYREPAVFAALEQHILPTLIAERRATTRSLRLWSAACCTGEEAYSLAILLHRLLPDLAQWNITLLATDINPHFLARAQRGSYREWSFRGTPAWFKDGYFNLDDNGDYHLLPAIRRLVRFTYLNLVDDLYPALESDTNGMDLVLCRNVLMYFEEQNVRAVVHKLRRALTPSGWLVLSATESSSALLAGFSAAPFPDALLYRKHEGPPPALPAAPALLEALPSWAATPLAAPTSWPPATGQAPERLASASLPLQGGQDRDFGEQCSPPVERRSDSETAQEGDGVKQHEDQTYSTARAPHPHPTPPLEGEGALGQPPAPPPSPSDGIYRQALDHYTRGAYAEAAATLADAAADDAPSQALAARAWANLGQLDQACRCGQAAVAADKCDPGLRYLLASLLSEQGSSAAAAAALKQALYLDQDFVLAHFALANLYRRLDQPAQAARHFATARQLLAGYPPGAALPAAEGLTAGRLLDIIASEGASA